MCDCLNFVVRWLWWNFFFWRFGSEADPLDRFDRKVNHVLWSRVILFQHRFNFLSVGHSIGYGRFFAKAEHGTEEWCCSGAFALGSSSHWSCSECANWQSYHQLVLLAKGSGTCKINVSWEDQYRRCLTSRHLLRWRHTVWQNLHLGGAFTGHNMVELVCQPNLTSRPIDCNWCSVSIFRRSL